MKPTLTSLLMMLCLSSLPAQQPKEISGIYPHLAMFNDEGECGTGAVVPWAGRLWVITYGPHLPFGSSDKLYEVTPELRQKTRDAAARCRELAALDAPPAPLPPELRHRCFGCSLAPVCLPEETLYQLAHPAPADAGAAAPPALTRVIPQSDDGAVGEADRTAGERGDAVGHDGTDGLVRVVGAHPGGGGVADDDDLPGLSAAGAVEAVVVG